MARTTEWTCKTGIRRSENKAVRIHANDKHVFLWQIADALGLSESGFMKKIRIEQPEEIQQLWIEAIDQIAAERDLS